MYRDMKEDNGSEVDLVWQLLHYEHTVVNFTNILQAAFVDILWPKNYKTIIREKLRITILY